MKNILVPTDFSTHAYNALQVAAQLARKNNSTIHLLHMLEMPSHMLDQVSGGMSGNFPEAILYMKNVHSKFEELKKNPILEGIDIHEDVNFEPIPKGVLKSCDNNKIDFIVVGSHGNETFTDLFVGSNTEKIVRSADCPVLVIKEATNVENVKQIVFACNFEDEDVPAVKKLNEFAIESNAKLHLVFINTTKSFKTTHELEEKMKIFIDKASIKNHTLNIYNDTSLERGVLNFSSYIKGDLICVGAHERRGLSHFINGSLSEDLVNHTKKPVLTFKVK